MLPWQAVRASAEALLGTPRAVPPRDMGLLVGILPPWGRPCLRTSHADQNVLKEGKPVLRPSSGSCPALPEPDSITEIFMYVCQYFPFFIFHFVPPALPRCNWPVKPRTS